MMLAPAVRYFTYSFTPMVPWARLSSGIVCTCSACLDHNGFTHSLHKVTNEANIPFNNKQLFFLFFLLFQQQLGMINVTKPVLSEHREVVLTPSVCKTNGGEMIYEPVNGLHLWPSAQRRSVRAQSSATEFGSWRRCLEEAAAPLPPPSAGRWSPHQTAAALYMSPLPQCDPEVCTQTAKIHCTSGVVFTYHCQHLNTISSCIHKLWQVYTYKISLY